MTTRTLANLLTLSPMVLCAQNLVLNPSFEDITCCPDSYMETHCAPHWTTNMNSWDLFNACAPQLVSVPDNFAGHQQPAIGIAYGGFIAWGPDPEEPPYFPIEIMGGTLSQPVQIGVEYYVSFKLSLAVNNTINCCMSDKIGILFVEQDHGMINYPAIGRPPVVQNFAHVYTDEMITDSIGWHTIEGSFIADEAYTHFLIGRFFTDPIDQQNCWGPNIEHVNRSAYYYVDDVYISDRPNVPNGIEDHNSIQVEVLYLPFLGRIDVSSSMNSGPLSVMLLDALGRVIANEHSPSSSLSIHTDPFAPGIYFICPSTNGKIHPVTTFMIPGQ